MQLNNDTAACVKAHATAMTTVLIAAMAMGVTMLLGNSTPVSAATNSATATVVLKATFTAPPCEVAMPQQIFLGSILPTTASHPPFTLQITCPDAASNAAIYGVAVGSNMVTASRLAMLNTAGGGGPAAQLWFTQNGSANEIALGVDGATDTSKQFCRGTGAVQTCTLIPWTYAETSSPKGETKATVTFTVVVP